VRVISKRRLREFYLENVQAEIPLTEWYFKMKLCNAKNIFELKTVFNSVDSVYKYTIFNIGGNNYRLITAIHYEMGRCYIKACWSHAEYSKRAQQDKLKRGNL